MAVASEIDCIDSNVTRKPRSWLSYVALFYTKHQIHALQLSPLRRLAARATACAAPARRPRSDTIRAMWSHCYDFFFLSLLPYRVDEVCTTTCETSARPGQGLLRTWAVPVAHRSILATYPPLTHPRSRGKHPPSHLYTLYASRRLLHHAWSPPRRAARGQAEHSYGRGDPVGSSSGVGGGVVTV
jgi:hypothetical protein